MKEPENHYDTEAIKVIMKQIGMIGYVANSVHTVVRCTSSAEAIVHCVKNAFTVEVLFMTDSYIICKIVEGLKDNLVKPAAKKQRRLG